MTTGLPAERVAELLVGAGYRRIDLPLQVAGLTFDIAGAFVGVGHSADLVLIGDMAADGVGLDRDPADVEQLCRG